MPKEYDTFCNNEIVIPLGRQYPINLYLYPHVIMKEDEYPVYLEFVPADVVNIATKIVEYQYQIMEHGGVLGTVTQGK